MNGENDFSALLSNDKNVIYLKSLDYVNTSTISISDNLYLFETYALNGISSLYLDVLWKKKFLNFLKISQELDIYLNWSVNTNSQIFLKKKFKWNNYFRITSQFFKIPHKKKLENFLSDIFSKNSFKYPSFFF